ncbi:MAG: hypothetical protein RL660_1637 [Bacteroidota bacterium]|jgi:hypothetical protein
MNKLQNFNLEAEKLFQPILANHGYTLVERTITQLHGQDWSAKHVYIHNKNKLRVEITQEPYYSDYGFSFTIFNTTNDECNMLCNVPHENQDKEDKFLVSVCDEIFSNEELVNIIEGKFWRRLGFIPIKW